MSVKYAVISQPMKGVDPDKVKLQREKAETAVRAAGYEPIDTVYEEDFKYSVDSDNSISSPVLSLIPTVITTPRSCLLDIVSGSTATVVTSSPTAYFSSSYRHMTHPS